MELLISIALLVLIVGVLGGALHMAHSALYRGEKKMHALERLKVSYFLMEAQIQSLQPYQNGPDGPKIFFAGGPNKLRLLSAYSLWRGAAGTVEVTYEVVAGTRGKQTLKVTERLPFQEKTDETTLLENCEKIQLDYFLKSGLEEGKWVENSGDINVTIPEKIRIHLICGATGLTYEFNAFAKPSEVAVAIQTGAGK